MKKTRNDSKRPNNVNNRPKPVTKTLPIVVTGKDKNGNDYDAESCSRIINELQDAGCFDKLSVNACIAKSLVINAEAKGTLAIARILKVDKETGDVDLLFFGKNAESAELVNDMVIVPRIRTARNSTEVTTITNFEIVPAMEA